MKLADKEAVLGALRSGNYRQMTGRYHLSGEQCANRVPYFCAVGVAAAALGINWEDNYFPCTGRYYISTFFLREHGIDQGLHNLIVLMNDAGKMTFPEIADVLEALIPVCDDLDTELEQLTLNTQTPEPVTV